ncbi:autotransporter-associated beta strand repeat-containing protein [Budvicia diplopodorum]|uniref:autotransporter-associated beta strand repeat-containing protein n=1 Tax=Budvicia diplopodorum TaxID=1119056 RepID=UPI00135A800B|nr:autotransporter-associated beta strand repeat-containing protein [Budvicia diplopodorum]
MDNKISAKKNKRNALNSLQKAIVIAFPSFYLGLSLSAFGAPTTLTNNQDIYTNGLNIGVYDLILDGDVNWNTGFAVNSAARSIISIDGNGYTISAAASSGQRLLDLSATTSTISINNAIITSKPFTGPQNALIKMSQSNDVANINLEGTTFLNIGPTDYNTFASADYGPILAIRGGTNSTMNIDGGTAGVVFRGNHGLADQPGVVGLYGQNTMNFKGKVTFDSNWTADYGGALSVYDVNGGTMSFADETNFTNNHSSVFGGAIDAWGGAASIQFNGPTTFSGNYVYGTTTNSATYPDHVDDQHSRGGAINIGYLSPGSAGVNLIFNNTTTFDGNYVIEPKNNYNALGGAVSAYGNGGNYNYLMTFNGATTFKNNYAYSLNGFGYGGAIYYDAGSAATLTLGAGSSVTNNYAKTLGGAIYLKTGTINLNANGGDITFQGNRQAASFTPTSGGLYAPVADSGNPNAIYLGGAGSLNMDASAGNFIHFYDPIASISTATIVVNKTGAGEVIFHGNNGDALYNSDIQTNTTVNGGTFSLTDGVRYGNAGFGLFAVNNGGTVQGNNGSTLQAQTININSGGTVAANGGVFNLNAGTGGITSTAGRFSGNGSIVAPSISLSTNAANISTADIASGNILILDSLLTNAGGLSKVSDGTLVLTKTNTYTGATSIAGGVLQANTTNIITASSGLNITGGTFDLNNFNQTLKSLSGTGGAITTGTGLLTVNSTASTTYAGTISGNGTVSKQGSGTLTLTGAIALLDPTSLLQVSGGGVVINGGNTVQVTKGTIDNASTMTVSNAGSNVVMDTLSIGNATAGNNTLTVNNGGQVNVANALYLGYAAGTAGYMTIDGTGSQVNAGSVQVGNGTGNGTVNLNNSGTLSTNSLQRGTGTTGIVNFNGGVLQAKSDNNSFISGFSTSNLVLGTNGGTIDSNGFAIATDNIFSGAGKLTKTGTGVFTLTGVNTYTGGTAVSNGTLRLTNGGTVSSGAVSIASGASLFVDEPSAGNYTFNNALSGAGLLQVGLLADSNTFQFGSGVGSAFAGTVQLGKSSFVLSGNNTAALTNAILQLDSGSLTTVGANTQNIGGLTLNGGKLTFNNLATGTINSTGLLTLNSGNISIDPNSIVNTSASLLTQDDGINFRLITSNGVSGSSENLTLTDLAGNPVVDTANIVQSSNIVAIGTYGFALGDDSTGLFTRYTLSQLDLQSGQTLSLSGDTTTPSGANELRAKLIGSGNLAINATTSITLNNAANTYTGSTTVASGTLIAGSDNALGKTSNLIISSGANTNLNGKTQTVGQLNGAGNLNINAGNLNITSGGSLAGVLSGTAGTLTLQGGTLTLTGSNSYTGDTQINSGSTLQIGSGGLTGDYAGNIANDGVVLFNRSNNSAYTGVISSDGSVTKNGAGTLTLSGANTYTGGTTISAGTLLATHGGALGTGTVANGSTLQLNFASNSTLNNVLSGTGSLVKTGSGVATLSGAGSTQGEIAVNAGTLNLTQTGAFNGESLTTASGATTALAADSTLILSDALSQTAGAILNIAMGSDTPKISADSATLGGTLNLSGIDTSVTPTSASDLPDSQYTVIHTTDGISGSFSSVNLGGAASSVDYLTLAGRVVDGVDYNVGFGLTWLAGTTLGNGLFTLTDSTDAFNVDVVLANQAASGIWNGTTLTKAGQGTLTLSAANTYTGDTLINAGTLRTGVANAFANSANVSVSSGTTLDLNNYAQQANNLTGLGQITLGTAALTANNSANTTFGGVISGTGRLAKTGTGSLTLSGNNTYQGTTTVSAGTLIATKSQALGTGAIANSGTLQLDFSADGALSSVLSGTGSLVKTGSGIATLSGTGSTQGAIAVNGGTLNLTQTGAFNGASLSTANGAATVLATNSSLVLSGALTQNTGSMLSTGIGSVNPAITALSASLSGSLAISGFSATAPTSASALTNNQFTVIHTTGGGITGDFTSVDLDGAASSVDYLTLAGRVVNAVDYNVGFGLTWLAGSTLGSGTFTLADSTDEFNVDVVLANQAASGGWNGTSLTKAGLGTLTLSAANTYTGNTLISAGTLRTGVNNAFASSANVSVSSGATLDLNNYAQQANNLSGLGKITLGTAALTANNNANTTFGGVISGTGGLVKTGTSNLTLSGINTYQGGTTISAGTLIATQSQALGAGAIANSGTLQLNFATAGTLSNVLSGTGSLVKTGTGIATLSGTGSKQGAIAVNGGTLNLAQTGAFNGASLTTTGGATTALAANSSLVLSGALTQNTSSTLSVGIGSVNPAITALSATLGGTLSISGFSATAPNSASALTGSQYTVIHTTDGISGNFSSVNLGGAASSVDYLTLAGRVVNGVDYNVGFGLTWLAGTTFGNGTFTLAAAADAFNVDVVLANQAAAGSWNGTALTKAGLGTLTLSAVNTYTGNTLINAGTLRTGVVNAFANSANVSVGNGATLDLNNYAQRANNLSGLGKITLGSAALTANNSANTTFEGVISGTGSLVKTGTSSLTLSGNNTYQGGSTISAGTLIATQSKALGTGAIANSATLQLDFATAGTLSNVLSGTGSLVKTGSGIATLSGTGSKQGAIAVNGGTLNLAQTGAFNGASLITANGATTALAADSSLVLSGALTQNTGSTLSVGIGSVNPAITAVTASLSGSLAISGFSTTTPASASALTGSQFTVIHTTGGITGNFTSVNLGGASSSVDYLKVNAGKSVDNKDYNVGFGLTWLAGSTLGNGLFTLANANDAFNVDVVLANQAASGIWNGTTLTKAGLGTLTLSSVNTYTGDTLINAGTLRTGVVNAFASSANVSVGTGSTLDLNNYAQQANNLSGLGQITLGTAALTANNSANTAFGGVISGNGRLAKTGTGSLTLSGNNTYQGGSTISAGTLIATQSKALGTGAVANSGTLQLDFATAGTLSNVLSGTGSLVKTGSGIATLSGTGSKQGAIAVNGGTLNLAQTGAFNGASLTTANGATTSLAADSSLVLSGALTQSTGSTLSVGIGSVNPAITALSASLSGSLAISGFSAAAPTTASALTGTQFTVIHTTSGGITGNFTNINMGGAASSVDYLTLTGRVVNAVDYNVGFGLTWLAGSTLGNGTFTLAAPTDAFNVDVVLANQAASGGWNGTTLTKAGQGTLTLSAANTYTGDTLINAGTLRTGVSNAFASSANVSVGSGATLNLNNYAQRANNLTGLGQITLGTAALTANNSANTTFGGVISGTGSLAKTGTGSLTLSGNNTYQGGSTVSAGTLIATQSKALGTGAIANSATLQLDFATDNTLSNVLSGTGSLVKTGSGIATLSGTGSKQGAIAVNGGTLNLAQTGAFTGASLTTAGGATTSLATDSSLALSGALTQSTGSTLNIHIGTIEPIISAATATLSGTLNVTGIDASISPTKASELPNTEFTLVRTTGGISGDFANIDLGGVSSSVDYLKVSAGKSADNKDYNVGFGLTWLSGALTGNGVFTLDNEADTFNVDIALADRATSATGWNGKDLTKEGAGTLILSSANTFTGGVKIKDGTLQTNVNNAFSNAASVTMSNGAELNLNNFSQIANNLSGRGAILLGNGHLTVNSLAATTFDGSINGNGSLIKTGTDTFTLTGINFYSGSTTINQGRLVGTQAQALGLSGITNNDELELAFAQDSTLTNQLSGGGTLIKSGAGIATLSTLGSSQGQVLVNEGKLKFTQNGAFNAGDYQTAAGATTSMAADASLTITNQFETEGTLEIVAGNTSPVITADTADLGSNSIFNLSGYSAPEAASATQLAYSLFNVIQTSAPGNLTGDFAAINLGGASSPVDYLSITAINDGQTYNIGLALTWYAAHTATPANANGTFTLSDANEYFDMDVVLADEAANSATGWDGKSLTKAGDGTLQLTKSNTYSGTTLINGGTLQAGHTDIIANSQQVLVADGATLNLNHFDQHVNNLSGAGNVVLGSATLTTNNTTDNTISGVISGSGNLTKTGSGTLILTNKNTFSGITTIDSGTLQLGNGGDYGSVMGDISDNGVLIFNHGSNQLYDAVISGSGDVIQQGTGKLALNKSQTYTGTTSVNSGGLVLFNDSVLGSLQTVTVAQGAMLGGYGGVNGSVINNGLLAVADAAVGVTASPTGNFTVGGNMINNGQILMASPDPRSRLIVKGNYVANNGQLTLSTRLGDDSSVTDKLVVLGDTSGTTNVIINNAGGTGAQTVNGIEVVSVAGQSNGQFTLANRVVAGAYEYSLYQGQPGLADGNWYLRSWGGNSPAPTPGVIPQYRPEIGVYLGNQSMTNLLQMQTLFDRQGSQFKSDNGNAWGRIISGHVDSKAAGGNIDMNGDYTLVQVGGDLLDFTDSEQRLSIGAMGSWGDVDTDSTGNRNLNGVNHSATGSLDGFSLGMYATWFADAKEHSGAYVDNWFQYGWYNNDVSGDGMAADKYDSRALTASVESGYSFILNDNSKVEWRLIPQAQVVYSKYSADRFVDSSNAVIDGQNNDSWSTRLGSRLTGKIKYDDYTLHPFTEVNWWHTQQGASVTLNEMRIDQDMPKNRAEMKVGIQSEFTDNLNTWVHLEGQTGADGYRSFGGGVGVSYSW